MRKTFYLIFLSFLLTLILLSPLSGADTPRFTVPVHNDKVVKVLNQSGRCTGFSISDHIIATCAHCIREGQAPYLDSGEPLTVLYVGTESTSADFALLWVEKPRAEWFRLRDHEPNESDPLIQVSKNPESFVISLAFLGAVKDGAYLVKGRVRPGDSGSPVLDQDNYVIGITFAYNPMAGDLGYLAPIGQVISKVLELKLAPPPGSW